ncbi:MAG: rRNA maturation RNase YbeY [Bacteroidales bacterium]|nr:rRNA maturation RNase YbeY [Bacteroidales bacterium]
MAIYFSSEDINFSLKHKLKVKKWISEVIRKAGCRVGDISYLFCSDAHLLGINQTYLDHDTYTDIITFDYVEDGLISGDILISVERVEENAQAFATTFDRELHRVIIHGVLHLLGQGDKTEADAARMRAREDEALALWDALQ